MVAGTIMASAPQYQQVFQRLIKASHKTYIDLETVVPWSDGIDRSKAPKKLDQMWMYGTTYFDKFTPEQRVEVAWLETARDASMFIHLEHVIPDIYAGYVSQHRTTMDPFVYEYLMLFSREELTHILAFHRYLKLAGLPWYAPPGSGTYADFASRLPTLRPEVGVIFILLIEWTAELAIMHATQSPEVEPITRQLFRAHHSEEIRHITFGKAIGDAFFATAPKAEADQIRGYMRALVQGLHAAFSFNPQIASYTSFKFPVDPNDEATIGAIQNSEHNRANNAVRFKELYTWCQKHGIA